MKAQWENNEFYVQQWADDPWYPALKRLLDAINDLDPHINIAQIKAKFGGLRFYYDLPDGLTSAQAHTIQARLDAAIREAERWCITRS